MTITPWTLYWITRLDGISGFFFGFVIASMFLTVVSICLYVDAAKGEKKINLFKFSIPLLIISILGLLLIPTTKEMISVLVVPKIVANERIQGIPDKFLTLADEWMEEMRPKKESK